MGMYRSARLVGAAMSYVITGATGHLGRLVVDSLLARGVDPGDIVATGRDTTRLRDMAARGVRVRAADYDDPASLRSAFAGASRVLLVSGTEVGRRVAQHQNAIDAARDAGVELLAYTSVANADHTTIQLAADHQATEQALVGSGVPYALLRNNLYFEVYTDQLPVNVQHQAVLGSAGDGRLSGAARADLAEAAAVVLLRDDQASTIYELGGDDAFTFADLAAAISDTTGRPVAYQDLPPEQYIQVLVGAGVPEAFAGILADSHVGIARGELVTTSGHLRALLGRPTTSIQDAVRAAADVAGIAA